MDRNHKPSYFSDIILESDLFCFLNSASSSFQGRSYSPKSIWNRRQENQTLNLNNFFPVSCILSYSYQLRNFTGLWFFHCHFLNRNLNIWSLGAVRFSTIRESKFLVFVYFFNFPLQIIQLFLNLIWFCNTSPNITDGS